MIKLIFLSFYLSFATFINPDTPECTSKANLVRIDKSSDSLDNGSIHIQVITSGKFDAILYKVVPGEGSTELKNQKFDNSQEINFSGLGVGTYRVRIVFDEESEFLCKYRDFTTLDVD